MISLLAKLVSMGCIALGCVLLLKRDTFDKLMAYVKEGSRIYICGGIRVVVGLVFMKASYASYVGWFVFLFGLLLLASGIAVFVLKKEKVFKFADKAFSKIPPKLFRQIGLIPLILGVLLLCAL